MKNSLFSALVIWILYVLVLKRHRKINGVKKRIFIEHVDGIDPWGWKDHFKITYEGEVSIFTLKLSSRIKEDDSSFWLPNPQTYLVDYRSIREQQPRD